MRETWPSGDVGEDPRPEACAELDAAPAHETGDRSAEATRALLAAVVESSEDAMITATTDGRITTWNPAAQAMYGYDATEAIGRMITDLVAPELAGPMMEIFGSVLAGERLRNLETRSIRKDGSVFWVSVTAFPVQDSAGRVLGGTSILRDISERRAIDARLRRQTAAMQMLQMVAVAANEASSLVQAGEGALAAVCTAGRWPAAHAYPVDEHGAQTAPGAWHVADPTGEALAASGASGSTALAVRALAEARPFSISDVAAEPGLAWLRGIPGSTKVSTVVIVPIVAGQKVYGVLELYGTSRSYADAEALEVLEQVGGMIGRLAERARGEDALRAGEERNRTILQTASDAFVGMDESGRITEWNHRAEALFGWPLPEVAGRLLVDTVVAAPFRSTFQAHLVEVGASGDTSDLRDRRDLTAVHRDGHEIPVEISVWPVHTGGRLTLNAFVRDNSERNRMAELQAQLASIVQSSDDAIVGLAPDSTITSWNPGAEALYGYREDEVLGRYVGILLPEKGAERTPVFARVAQGERIQNRETEARRKDGSVVAISLSASPILDGTGQVIGISSIARDITDRRRAARAIEEMNARLARSVEELERRNTQVTLINEMGDLLQSCLTIEEACRVIAGSMARLFAGDSGALCLIAASRNMLDAAAVWGPGPTGDSPFSPDACWALRRGRIHVVAGPGSGPHCLHAGKPPPEAYVCVPMMAQGETLGLLHVRCRPGVEDTAAWAAAAEQLAGSVAEHLSLSLGNFRLRETLRNQSIRDPLTGLYNRRYAEESLEREVRRAGRKRSSIGLIAIDLDHFKRFNDRYGHEVGDVVLRLLSEYLAASVREGDIACRYGGEEFLLILPDAPLQVTANRAEGIRDGVRAIVLPPSTAPGEGLTVSLGVAAFPQHGDEVRRLVRVADLALYRAKAAGRDQVVVAEPGDGDDGDAPEA